MGKTAHALDFTFPEEYLGYTTYREAPFHLREPFTEHVKRTYTPETFPGLYWGRLNTNEPFEIIRDFAVDRKKRPNGDYIPCPMCRKREKFLEGALVFIFARQCIAIIGHDCAAAEVKHAALSKKKRDDARRHQEDFLMSKLHLVPGTLQTVERLKPIAKQIDGIYHAFRNGAPTIQKALRQARKDGGGELVLSEILDNEVVRFDAKVPRKITEDYRFGWLRGEAMVRTNTRFLTELRIVEQWLLSFADCDDEEKALNKTIELIDSGEAIKPSSTSGRRTGSSPSSPRRWRLHAISSRLTTSTSCASGAGIVCSQHHSM